MSRLPEPFSHLQPYSHWAHSTEDGRMRQRFSATIEEINEYYQALLPEMNQLAEHLSKWPLAELPDEQKPLLYMALMFMETAMSAEFFFEPDVPEALGAEHMQVFSGRAEQLVNS